MVLPLRQGMNPNPSLFILAVLIRPSLGDEGRRKGRYIDVFLL